MDPKQALRDARRCQFRLRAAAESMDRTTMVDEVKSLLRFAEILCGITEASLQAAGGVVTDPDGLDPEDGLTRYQTWTRRLILHALRFSKGNMAQTQRWFGLRREAFEGLMRACKVDPKPFRPAKIKIPPSSTRTRVPKVA